MNLTKYIVEYTDEFKGNLIVVISHEGEEYTIEFTFEERGTKPGSHSPFPSSNKTKFAWPKETIPACLQAKQGNDSVVDVLEVSNRLSNDIELLSKPYSEHESTEEVQSPFVQYTT